MGDILQHHFVRHLSVGHVIKVQGQTLIYNIRLYILVRSNSLMSRSNCLSCTRLIDKRVRYLIVIKSLAMSNQNHISKNLQKSLKDSQISCKRGWGVMLSTLPVLKASLWSCLDMADDEHPF